MLLMVYHTPLHFIAVCYSPRQDFTTLQSYHSSNYFMFPQSTAFTLQSNPAVHLFELGSTFLQTILCCLQSESDDS